MGATSVPRLFDQVSLVSRRHLGFRTKTATVPGYDSSSSSMGSATRTPRAGRTALADFRH